MTRSGRGGDARTSRIGEMREQAQYMPIANVIRIMRRILPPHAKISDEAKETIQGCVSEYISFVTGEANDHCQREQRKTVTAKDILWALAKLGFDDYVGPLSMYLHRYREVETNRGWLRSAVPPFLWQARATDFGQVGDGMASYDCNNASMGNLPFGSLNHHQPQMLPGGYCGDGIGGTAPDVASASATQEGYANLRPSDHKPN